MDLKGIEAAFYILSTQKRRGWGMERKGGHRRCMCIGGGGRVDLLTLKEDPITHPFSRYGPIEQ